ncbi:hypothetical protein C8R43DRAFT_958710 [Mycena crocata]|nr:hypothetical protein C8R43DRAFT_958710 [Mycena crocata]
MPNDYSYLGAATRNLTDYRQQEEDMDALTHPKSYGRKEGRKAGKRQEGRCGQDVLVSVHSPSTLDGGHLHRPWTATQMPRRARELLRASPINGTDRREELETKLFGKAVSTEQGRKVGELPVKRFQSYSEILIEGATSSMLVSSFDGNKPVFALRIDQKVESTRNSNATKHILSYSRFTHGTREEKLWLCLVPAKRPRTITVIGRLK